MEIPDDMYVQLRDEYFETYSISARRLHTAASISTKLVSMVVAHERSPRRRTAASSSIDLTEVSPKRRLSIAPDRPDPQSPADDDDEDGSTKGRGEAVYNYDISTWDMSGRILPEGYQVAALIDEHSEPNLWILASVLQYHVKRKRYRVIDEDAANNTGSRKIYTLSAEKIVPLPSLDEVPYSRRVEFPVGEQVLAIYPKSTVFYPATVTKTPPKKSKGHTYQLEFQDDDELVRSIELENIVPLPARYF